MILLVTAPKTLLYIFVAIDGLLIILFLMHKFRIKKRKRATVIPQLNYNEILIQEVVFYQNLDSPAKKRFEKAITDFINRVHIEWIGAEANVTDKVLVAASAVIPIFALGDWHYPNLTNVIIYPDTFNNDFEFENGSRTILGMVGSGYMNGQMILSQRSLRAGFSQNAHSNTGIHEFVHLLDKSDGATDGIPTLLLDKPYIIPWIDLMHKEIQKINHGDSEINPYGATNESEFFAVVAEYFFSQPDKLKLNHPELYSLLEKVFQQNPKT